MSKKSITVLSLFFLSLPVIGFAVSNPALPTVIGGNQSSVISIINAILEIIWPLFIGFAVIMFIYAGFLFLSARGEESQISTARSALFWGAVGVVVGVIAFSLPYFLQASISG